MDTVNPPGNEAPLARLLAGWARARGLETEVVDLPDPRAPRGRAALWARVRGQRRGGALVLLSHLDVVPPGGGDWSGAGPFEGLQVGDALVGRGALDAKSLSVAHLAAAVRIQRKGPPLHDVIVLATPDEEAGGLHGAARLLRERPDLIAGAQWVLGEGGGITEGVAGIPSVWRVGVAEKAPCWLRLEAHGTPGHPAFSFGDSAVTRLLRALRRVEHLPLPTRVAPEVARAFRELAPLAPPAEREAWLDLERALQRPDFARRFLATPRQAALVRDTVAVTLLRGSPRINQVPALAVAGLDARLLPGGDCAAFAGRLREVIDDPAVQVRVELATRSRSSPADTALMAAIRRTAARLEPGALVVPTVGLGASDSHWFRERGLVAYGFQPRRVRPIDARGIHGPRERIALANFEWSIDALGVLLDELDRSP